MIKPFGYTLMIDMYGCEPNSLDCLETHYRVLEGLVFRLHMTRMCPPIVIHGPNRYEWDNRGVKNEQRKYYDREMFGDLVNSKYHDNITQKTELYPEKSGVSCWQGLIESGIQIHSCSPVQFSTIDIYSCNDFDKYIPPIKEFLQTNFKFQDYDEHFVIRGAKYYQGKTV